MYIFDNKTLVFTKSKPIELRGETNKQKNP